MSDEKPKRPYICGSISNGGTATPEEREANVARFFEAEEQLKEAGLDPINPARRGSDEGTTWLDYMRDSLRDIAECDGLAWLDGYEQSAGAMVEFRLVGDLGMPIANIMSWVYLKGEF